jgi:hypothetical protein
VAQHCVLRIGHIEIAFDQTLQNRLGQRVMEGSGPGLAREGGVHLFARDDGERRHGLEKEGLHVIAAENDDRVGFGRLKPPSQFPHTRDSRVELGGIFLGRPGEELRCVNSGHCGDDFSHVFPMSPDVEFRRK